MKLSSLYTLALVSLCQTANAQPSEPVGMPVPVSTVTKLVGDDIWEVREYDGNEERFNVFRYVLQNKIAPNDPKHNWQRFEQAGMVFLSLSSSQRKRGNAEH